MKILLTGKPGVGKSFLLGEILQSIKLDSLGFKTEEIRVDGERKGFVLVDSFDNKETFMHTNIKSDLIIGDKYHVAIDVLDNFVDRILLKQRSINKKDYIYYIDEIGRAQINSNKFRDLLAKMFLSESIFIGTIVLEPEPWSIQFKNHKDTILIEVTVDNRTYLKEIILAIIDSCYAYKQLSSRQRSYTYERLLFFLKEEMFIQAKKLFYNSVHYVASNLVQMDSNSRDCFIVHGRTRKHNVGLKKDYYCDCDLFKGINKFEGSKGVCSHIESVKLFLIN